MTMNIINLVDEENYQPLIKKVLKKAYKKTLTSKKRVINIVLVSNEKIKELNRDYRNKDSITDVLTFPSDQKDELGDVFIALHKTIEQAKEYGHSFERELAFLVIHGFLHAIGFDHHDETEAERMFSMQRTILDELDVRR